MKTSDYLEIGRTYSRAQLSEQFNIKDATIRNGIFHPRGHDSLWLFITENKTSDRTQYNDLLEGDVLKFDGQTSGRTDEMIINHRRDGIEILVFYRKEKYEFPHAAFFYHGCFDYISHDSGNPSRFIIKRTNPFLTQVVDDIAGYTAEEGSLEGEVRARLVNRYERNPKLRVEALQIHGAVCRVCGFDFEKIYGVRGRGFIEVHHIVPMSITGGPMPVNPRTDMVVLCANCHRMIHRKKDSVLSVEELIEIYERNHRSTTQQ